MYESPEIIKTVGALLRKPLSADNLKELEAVRFDLAEATVDTLKLLYDKRKQMLWPKDVPVGKKDPTELDRSTYLAADTSVIERDYQFLIRIEELIKDRIRITERLLGS